MHRDRKTAVRTLRHFRTAARHGPEAAIKSERIRPFDNPQ
jgi:hypothetical protein